MKIILSFILMVFLSSCATMDESYDTITDDGGYIHHTIKLKDDRRGQNYFPKNRVATGKKVFIFDPNADAWAAYDAEGNRVMTGSASGGRDECPDEPGHSCRTVTGTFRVYNKKGADCRSSEYPLVTDGGARMPYCMHFYKGYAIHAAYEVPNFNASHGCIRVLPGAAKWLNQHFVDIGTTVVVRPYDYPNSELG